MAVRRRSRARRAGQAGVRGDAARAATARTATAATYPNLLIVPLDDVGTDPTLAAGTAEFAGASSSGSRASFWGETSQLAPQQGYVAPPLDGIWATAPFFHNGSVPTIAAVLDTQQAPDVLGAHLVRLDRLRPGRGRLELHGDHARPGRGATDTARVKIYDTTLPGYGNAGHPYGDALSRSDRRAVIEYLKTL